MFFSLPFLPSLPLHVAEVLQLLLVGLERRLVLGHLVGRLAQHVHLVLQLQGLVGKLLKLLEGEKKGERRGFSIIGEKRPGIFLVNDGLKLYG